MLISELKLHPYTSRYYLERYVNDGSPSGFSTMNTTKPRTSPFELNAWFNPYICFAPEQNFKDYGDIPIIEFPDLPQDNSWIIVHPDMSENPFFNNRKFILRRLDEIRALPTASGRTIQILDKYNEDYIKLHYIGILGRVRRELPYIKAIAGPELSIIISNAIKNQLIDPRISILPELGARVLYNEEYKHSEWGMIWRQNEPLGLQKESYHFLFPSFSLFSMDRLNIHHFPLLKQIIDFYQFNPEEYVLETILFPLICCYFDFILKLGLQPELNSQNLLLGFNHDFSSCVFVFRDLESIDKDITIMKALGQNFQFECYPYKCIEENQYNYSIKHSFMYDFKLGESILDPIITLLNKYYNIDIGKLRLRIKEIASFYIEQLPKEFFPKDKWYVFDKVLVDQSKTERPYIEIQNPKFR
jgi:hypothetical protein